MERFWPHLLPAVEPAGVVLQIGVRNAAADARYRGCQQLCPEIENVTGRRIAALVRPLTGFAQPQFAEVVSDTGWSVVVPGRRAADRWLRLDHKC